MVVPSGDLMPPAVMSSTALQSQLTHSCDMQPQYRFACAVASCSSARVGSHVEGANPRLARLGGEAGWGGGNGAANEQRLPARPGHLHRLCQEPPRGAATQLFERLLFESARMRHQVPSSGRTYSGRRSAVVICYSDRASTVSRLESRKERLGPLERKP